MNMFIARNIYEVATLAYFERDGIEKQRGGPPHSSQAGETLRWYCPLAIGHHSRLPTRSTDIDRTHLEHVGPRGDGVVLGARRPRHRRRRRRLVVRLHEAAHVADRLLAQVLVEHAHDDPLLPGRRHGRRDDGRPLRRVDVQRHAPRTCG